MTTYFIDRSYEMSTGIVFKPTIPFHFASGKGNEAKVKSWARESRPWSEDEIAKLIRLRALAATYKDCGKMLDRSQTATANIVAQQGLYKEIEDKRKILLMEVFNSTPDSTKGIF
tara:strand:+ start:2562 stop:2906 length:345 start_codon:yes stop_codon:yes gene_type:complete